MSEKNPMTSKACGHLTSSGKGSWLRCQVKGRGYARLGGYVNRLIERAPLSSAEEYLTSGHAHFRCPNYFAIMYTFEPCSIALTFPLRLMKLPLLPFSFIILVSGNHFGSVTIFWSHVHGGSMRGACKQIKK